MEHKKHPLLSPSVGTQRYVDSFHFGQAGGKKVYIQSSLHADELPGMFVVWKLKQALKVLEDDGLIEGEIVLVPVANPIGQNQHLMDLHLGRYETESGQNFNRGYFDAYAAIQETIGDKLTDSPEQNLLIIRDAIKRSLDSWSVSTEFHSLQKHLQLMSYDADILLDLHCDFEAILHFYATEYSWGQIEPLARMMGSKMNLLADETGGAPFDCHNDTVWLKLKETFGEVIPQGNAAATLELRGQMDVTDELSSQDSMAIINYLSFLGVVKKDSGALPDECATSSPLEAVETPTASQAGLVNLKVKPGEVIEKGAIFAEIIDPITDAVDNVRASQSGLVYSTTNRKVATAGMLLGNVAGKVRVRKGYLLAP